MQYQQNDPVVYGSHGVCTIVDIEEKNIDKKMVQYYVLEPQNQPGTKYYIPVHNEVALSKMRRPLTREVIEEMCAGNTPICDCWIDDENCRKLRYRELIGNCEPLVLFSMVRLLRVHRDAQLTQGRKFHICDANFLKDAENLLAGEFAFVLGIDKTEAMNMI